VKNYDLVVVGGGPAGYNCAQYAAKNGLSVALFEKEKLGGTCLNAGCIPTKSLLYSAKIFHYAVEAAEGYGIRVGQAALDHAAVMAQKDAVVERLVQGVASGLRKCGVDVFTGEAAVEKKDGAFVVTGGTESVRAASLILASGSVPAIPPIPGAKEGLEAGYVVTSNELLRIQDAPKRLVIVGGGVIGIEMACYFSQAGSRVTVIDILDKILGESDREISSLLQSVMTKQGVKFRLGAQVRAIEKGRIVYDMGGKTQEEKFDTLLLCTGRRPNLAVKGLEELGLAIERGAIVTDEKCCTNVPNVYAIGDVNGRMMLAHVGYREGEVAANIILGRKDIMDYSAVCSVVYTQPEAAFVGMSEEQAKTAGIDYVVKMAPINFSGRHMVENGLSNGLCKILVDKAKNIIIGASILSAYSSEYVYALALMIQNKIPVESILRTVFPHPTVCEIIREALLS